MIRGGNSQGVYVARHHGVHNFDLTRVFGFLARTIPQNLDAQVTFGIAHAGSGSGTVSAFSVSRSGAVSSIGASPYADGQTAPCWVEITHDGNFLFAVNTGSTTLSSYAIQSDGSLQLIGSTGFSSGTGIRPFDARLDPSGSTLYVVDAALDAVSAFAVSGGSLTELPQSPFALPSGATPFGIVAA